MKHQNILIEINAILEDVSKALQAERSTVYLINEAKKTLDSLISQGIQNNLISMSLDVGISGYVARTGKLTIENDVAKNDLFNPYYDSITGFYTRKTVCVPILNSDNKVIGVIQVLNKVNADFNKEDVSILKSFANAFALAIKNEKLYYSAEAIKQDIATLLKVSSSINSELDLNNLIALIIRKASEITQSDRSSFFLLDEEEDVLWTKFGEGLDGKIIKTRKGLAYFVAKSKTPLIENNPYQNPHFDQTVDLKMGYQTKSIVSVPVFDSQSKVIGVIQSINKKNGAFSNKDLFILNGFASQISIAIQNSTLFEEINNIKNYLDTLFENLDNGILTIDKNGIIKTTNKRFCDILGIQAESLIGKYFKALDAKYFSFLNYSDYTFISGERFTKLNIESINLSNKKLVLNFNSLPMKDKDDNNIGVINVIHDITSKERVRENLTRYLPQHVIDEIINKEDLSLFNGKYIKSTILFSDIRNFTTLTERLKAIETVNFLNHYFDVMVNSILKYDGVLDKLIGDAIMATFGVPYAKKNDALNAAQAALDMVKNLHLVNDKKLIDTNLDIGIGIATGKVISGNIGSQKRFEYTVIGDSVNLAARLEGLTKYYGLKILVCENTCKEISDSFLCREIDTVKAKGKKQSATIYTILDKDVALKNKDEETFLKHYSEGLNLYRSKKFNGAIKVLSQALSLRPNDHPTQLLIKRSNNFITSPPPSDWSGVWSFFEK